MEVQNDFMILRQIVNDVVNQYTGLRKRIDWKDKGKSATIMRLAKPFQTGYFTIAVAGKMSAGKSTFINSLIGENLLPTGHFQTTSGITWIVSSDKRYMEVKYANGNKKSFTTNLAEELRQLVAVPDKFDNLPIYDINNLIKQGENVTGILQMKEGIEERTQTFSTESLWKEYISLMPKSRIPEEVVIYLPLPKEYEGWRIVDTPGVGAIGGIQDATKKLLTAKEGEERVYAVDAVIFLHNCKENIQDESANKFADEIKKHMGDLAKGRLFFVLTHACDTTFRLKKDATLDKAEALFGTKLNIPRSRINYIDSLVHHFITSAKKSKKDFSNPKSLSTPLEGWNEDEWAIVKGIVSPIYMEFMMAGKECTNTTLFSELENISRFESLRNMLNEFLNDEKQKAFSYLLDLIEEEFETYGKSLKKDVQSVSNGRAAIDQQIKEVEKEKNQLNKALGKVRDNATRGAIEENFSFIDNEFQKLSQLNSIGEVRTAFLQVIEKGLSKEKELFSSLIREFTQYVKDFDNMSTAFDSLDFDQIEIEATKSATERVTDYNRPETEYVCCGDDKTTYPYKKDKVDFDKKRREFTAKVISKGRVQFAKFKQGLEYKINAFYVIATSNIESKTGSAINRLQEYKNNLANKDTILSSLKTKLACVEAAKKSLKVFEE